MKHLGVLLIFLLTFSFIGCGQNANNIESYNISTLKDMVEVLIDGDDSTYTSETATTLELESYANHFLDYFPEGVSSSIMELNYNSDRNILNIFIGYENLPVEGDYDNIVLYNTVYEEIYNDMEEIKSVLNADFKNSPTFMIGYAGSNTYTSGDDNFSYSIGGNSYDNIITNSISYKDADGDLLTLLNQKLSKSKNQIEIGSQDVYTLFCAVEEGSVKITLNPFLSSYTVFLYSTSVSVNDVKPLVEGVFPTYNYVGV